MDYVISIFLLGLIVTFVVAKGIMMSYELAAAELQKQETEEAERLQRAELKAP